MTWQAVSKETRVSATKITYTGIGGRMEVDGMLAIVKLLNAMIKSFVNEQEF